MLEVDGHHVAIALLLSRGVVADYMVLEIGDQQEKYLMLESVATNVLATGADEVILTSEAWMAGGLPPS